MRTMFDWIKTHKLMVFLVLIILFLLLPKSSPGLITGGSIVNSEMAAPSMGKSVVPLTYPVNDAAPRPNITDRKVITNSNFSLLVKDVNDTVDKIKQETISLSGYVISSNIDRTQYATNADIQIRVPINRVEEVTKYLRGLAVKVVSENVNGNDITDQYVDIQERINQLNTEKAKMEEIMQNAKTVSEMMEVQQALFTVQDQIDSYKGQLVYFDGTTSTTKLTVSLSTDELSLPYAPAQPWRPEVIFKTAVRSLLGTLQGLGSIGIWLLVYSPLFIIAYLIYRLIRRKKSPVVK